MQLAAGGADVQLIASTTGLDRQVGITLAGQVADPGQQATGELHAITFQQLLTQGPKGFDMHQHHAFVAQPDQTFLGVEIEPVDQVLHIRKAQVSDDVDAMCDCANGANALVSSIGEVVIDVPMFFTY